MKLNLYNIYGINLKKISLGNRKTTAHRFRTNIGRFANRPYNKA